MAGAGEQGPGGGRAEHQARTWWEVDPARLAPRLQADLEVVKELAAAQFDLADPGVASWVEGATKLCAGTLENLRKDNKLFPACRRLGMLSLPAPPTAWAREARRIIAVTASLAAPRFVTEKIIDWLPEESALSTFFINTSLFDFEKVYRSFCREEGSGSNVVFFRDDENVEELFPARDAGPEACALDRISLLDAITLMGDPMLAQIIVRIVGGMSREQIAADLNTNTKKIYRVLEEFRQKLNECGFVIRKGRDDK